MSAPNTFSLAMAAAFSRATAVGACSAWRAWKPRSRLLVLLLFLRSPDQVDDDGLVAAALGQEGVHAAEG